ncbi:MAG: carbohydrate-binding domain-containing protein [Oscillospiraceae bacterium]|nr:carbohydrate-binding domain-containing protein [Oscillospiraceae bacterium]
MSTHRNIDRICIVVLVLTLLLTVAFMNGEKLGIRAVADEDAESYSGSEYFTANDLDGDWADNAYTTYITLDSSGGKIDGNGAYFLDGDLVISGGGWYVLSGTLEGGSIIVDAYDSSKIWIRLDGVTVSCSDDACLRIDQADKVFLTLAEGTENAFSSGSSYSEEALADNTGGAVFARDDLTINGSGSLTITAGYKHGIDANDSLVITGGNIAITAPQDGIHVNDSFRFTAASLTIDAGDDAVHSDDELYVESGMICITSCYEGLEAITIDITGGDITIYPSDDGINANGSSSAMGFGGGMGDAASTDNTQDPGGGEENGTSAGSDSQDGEMPSMPSGAMSQATEETAQTADASSSEQEETYIRISGGNLTIVNETGRDADGLDSNGSIYIDGGTIHISLLGDGGNCAIDYGSESGGEFIVTGGKLLAFGDSSMAEEFSSASTQCAVLYNLDSSVQAGTLFQVISSTGEEILSYSPACSYSSIAFSSPDLTVGETYTVVYGESSAELTLESTAMTVGNSGGMGGMQPGNMNNMQPGNMGSMDTEDAESTAGGSFPGSEGTSDSERPTPPDGGMGTPPQQRNDDNTMQSELSGSNNENSSEGAETENSGGNSSESAFPQNNGSGGMSGFMQEEASSTADTENVSDGFVSLTELDGNVWILLGMSFFILAAAILFALKYRQ